MKKSLKRNIMDRESDEYFESEHKYRIVKEGAFLLKHAAKFYTRNVLNEFKDEWSKVNLYKVKEMPCDNEYHAYLVKTKLREHEEFVVKLNLQTYKDTLLDHFILPRWRQDANKFRIMDLKSLVTNDASSNEAYTTSMEAINELSQKLSENSTQHATIPSSTTGNEESEDLCQDMESDDQEYC
ncbi:hypothetical protein L3X38_032565 [Prunus dulcis]|uniref:Uncharacterized protein n=1 Tax=Prunus dulcis TaxID=3755 RepID=A0AAD4VEL1_PRUDU|nr:hypothetical protein L3X38_032565 [Prunus dulcis]